MAVHTKSETSFGKYKNKCNGYWERRENLQYILKSAPYESLGKIKRQNKEIFKNIGWPNKTLNRSKDNII